MKEYYYPRTIMAEKLLNNIQTEDSMNIMLFKPRRTGKTSFLKKDLLEMSKNRFDKDVFCFYFSFFNSNKKVKEEFIFQFLIEISKDFSLKNKMKDFLDFIKKIGMKINYDKEESFNISLFVNDLKETCLNLNLDLLFRKFKEYFPKRKLFLLLDEFQEVSILNKNQQDDFVKDLRTAIDFNHDFVKVIFTGSSYNKLMSFFNDSSKPFYNFGFHLKLNDFDENFIEHLLSVYFENTKDLTLRKETLLKWFEETNKSPYYISETLKILQNNIYDGKKDVNELFDLEIKNLLILDKELIEKETIHINYWNGLSEIEKFLLLYILKRNGKITTKEIKNKILLQFHLNSEVQVKNKINYAIKKLIKSEKIIKEKEYMFSDLKFKEWLLNSSYFDYFNI